MGWRESLRRQGITFPQFAFQFIIVLTGVYLAIVFEGRAADEERRDQADVALAQLAQELGEDHEEFAEVLAVQSQMTKHLEALYNGLVNPGSMSASAIDSILNGGGLDDANRVSPSIGVLDAGGRRTSVFRRG